MWALVNELSTVHQLVCVSMTTVPIAYGHPLTHAQKQKKNKTITRQTTLGSLEDPSTKASEAALIPQNLFCTPDINEFEPMNNITQSRTGQVVEVCGKWVLIYVIHHRRHGRH